MSWSWHSRPQDPDADEPQSDPIEGRPDDEVKSAPRPAREKSTTARTPEMDRDRRGDRRTR